MKRAPFHLHASVIVLVAGLALSVAQAQFLPDLTIREIEVFPNNPAPGEDITVVVTAENVGNFTPLEETIMYLWVDEPVQPDGCTHDYFQALEIAFPPKTQRVFTFFLEGGYSEPGPKLLWAWIDGCVFQIEETNELNNWLSRPLNVGLGDLRVISIDSATPDPVPGQPVMLNVAVRNFGPALDEAAWWIHTWYDAAEPPACTGWDDSRGPFLSLPANGIAIVQFGPVTYLSNGRYPVWAWVDCEENIPEADDNNNKLFGEIAIGRPDLLIDSITPSVTTPTINVPFTVDVVLRNAGSRPAGSFWVAIAPDSPTQPVELSCAANAQYIVTIEPAATLTLTFSVTYTESRAHRLWAIADACGMSAEAREDNNALSRDINVGNNTINAPDLVVESITVSEIPAPDWGAVSTFDVLVRNVGNVTSAPFRVGDFALPDFPGVLSYVVIGTPGPNQGGGVAIAGGTWNDCGWRSRDVPSLVPGASATVQFWRYFSQSGHYSFGATADVCGSAPNHNVFESSEENNFLSVEFDIVACDADADRDGLCDAEDLCPNIFDPLNNDSDADGLGDACDEDDDADGALDAADCQPRNPFIFPGAVENCADGIDNNCDGQIDEGAQTLHRDADADGFGNPTETVRDCTRTGYVTNPADCNDADARIHPGANGPCNDGLDNDCDGIVDNEHPVWGRDADADGFTNPGDIIRDDDGICDGQPAGYSLVSAVPDPDDTDFMTPEPVRPDPASVLFSVPAEVRPEPQVLALVRNGPESFLYDITVTYGPDSQGFLPSSVWLSLDASSGAALNGRAEVLLMAEPSPFRADYPATLHVSINGRAVFDVAVIRRVRHPQLTLRHAGQGDGSLMVGSLLPGEPTFGFDSAQGVFEAIGSVSDGALVSLIARTQGDCSTLVELVDAQGTALEITDEYFVDEDGDVIVDENGFPAEDASGPGISKVSVATLEMDADQEITARFALSGNACTACAIILLVLSIVGMRLTWRSGETRRRAPRRPGS